MLIFVGYFVVIFCTLVGYLAIGGYVGALYQPAEFLIIAGAALGAFIVSNNWKSIKATCSALVGLLRKSKYNKALYMDLMAVLFLLLTKIRQQGMLALEGDIDNPQESEIFSRYPRILEDQRVNDFITDYFRLMISGNMNAAEIEVLMDEEIATYQDELGIPVNAIAAVGDGLPAFGIVGAVMGVINTLAQADRATAEIGELIAHAMVGTFLGILLAYGFVTPLSELLRQRNGESSKILECIKVTMVASMNGYVPQNSVEFGRKVLYSTERPSFFELEEHVRQVRSPTKSTADK